MGDFFFFQAEDGIRDLVRSRGLGDVYKRQLFDNAGVLAHQFDEQKSVADKIASDPQSSRVADAVSYTHLTLPTSDLV